jgi:uncharacterized protein YoxC
MTLCIIIVLLIFFFIFIFISDRVIEIQKVIDDVDKRFQNEDKEA